VPLMMMGLMKAMVPTMVGIPPPGMAAGAAAAGPAIPLAIQADILKKNPYLAPLRPGKGCKKPTKEGKCGKPPTAGPTAIEKALCKVRQEQECARKKPRGIHFDSAYASAASSSSSSSFLEFMMSYCGGDKESHQNSGACAEKSSTADASDPVDPLKVLESIINGQSTDDVEVSDGEEAQKKMELASKEPKVRSRTTPMNPKCQPYAIVRFKSTSSANAALAHFGKNNQGDQENDHHKKQASLILPVSPSVLPVSLFIDLRNQKHQLCSAILSDTSFMSEACRKAVRVERPTHQEVQQALCVDQTSEPTGSPRLDPCDLITFHKRESTRIYRVMKVDRTTNVATLDRPYVQDPLENDYDVYGEGDGGGGGGGETSTPPSSLSINSYKTFKLSEIPNIKGDLEKLALEKMKCQTMACIDAIEIQEKSIGWNDGGVRALNGIRGGKSSTPAVGPAGIGQVIPAQRTEETCVPKDDHEQGDYIQPTSEEIAAMSKAGKSTFAGAALKEYEDMPVSAGGEGWPGVDASTRKDTMDASKGTLMWKNRL
jgi:hypothetical protein